MQGCRKFGFLLVFAIFLLNCRAKSPPPSFPILAWHGPDRTFSNRQAYEMIRAAGFTHNFSAYKERRFNLRALAWADSAQIKLLVPDERFDRIKIDVDSTLMLVDSVIFDYRNHPALWGYFLQEGPGMKDFPRLARIVQAIREKDPDHPPYINLLPSYATAVQLDTTSYEGYVREFVRTVRPAILSFYHHPILEGSLRPDYFHNLEIIRQAAIENDIPFWAFVRSVRFRNHSEPQLAHLRFQVYCALAYGAKGIRYFADGAPKADPLDYGDALLNADGKPTRTYSYVSRMIDEIQTLAPLLMTLKSVAVYHTDPVPQGCQAPTSNAPVHDVEGAALVVGWFEGPKGEQYLFLVNRSYETGALPTIFFSSWAKRIEEISKNNTSPVEQDWEKRVTIKTCRILFKAGEGKLFRYFEYE